MKQIECQGEDCGRMANEVDEDYYACHRCGWAGSENNPVVVLEKQLKEANSAIEELKSELIDCHDLLNDCGFEMCKKCNVWRDTEYECAGCGEE